MSDSSVVRTGRAATPTGRSPLEAAGVLALLLVLAGCSGGTDGGAAPASSAPAAPTSAAVPAVTVAATTVPPPPTAETVAEDDTAHVFPIDPPDGASYLPDHHDYPAADIFAPCGSNVVAVGYGVVSEIELEDRWDPGVDDGSNRGGLSVTLVDLEGVRYYGSHLQSVAAGIEPGLVVTAGQVLGRVGETGNAAGTGCHLHFGISPPCGVGDWEVRRGVIWPAPYLDAWRAGDSAASPLEEVRSWEDANRAACPG
jgi:peptidoglycan LD-endopeptidase LytH